MDTFINISIIDTLCTLTKTYWKSYIFPNTPSGVRIGFVDEKASDFPLICSEYRWNIIISPNNFILWDRLMQFVHSKDESRYTYSFCNNDDLLFITNFNNISKKLTTNNGFAHIIETSAEFIDVIKFMNSNTVEWCVSTENLNIISRILLYYYFPKHHHIFRIEGSLFCSTGLNKW